MSRRIENPKTQKHKRSNSCKTSTGKILDDAIKKRVVANLILVSDYAPELSIEIVSKHFVGGCMQRFRLAEVGVFNARQPGANA